MRDLTENDIQAQESRVRRLYAAYQEAKSELITMKDSQAEFHVGDEIEAEHWRSGKFGGPTWEPALVRKLEHVGGVIWYYVSWRLKNGEFSEVTRNVMTKVRKPEGEA